MVGLLRGKLRIPRPYLLLFIISICVKLNAFTVIDTTSLIYYEDYKIDINSADYKTLLSVPYIDSIKAMRIVQARKKWGKIIDKKMLEYILGRDYGDIVFPYINFTKQERGIYSRGSFIYDKKAEYGLTALYKGKNIFLGLNSSDKKKLSIFTMFRGKGYDLIAGNYAVSLPYVTQRKKIVSIHRYFGEKRGGVALEKYFDNWLLLFSAKFININTGDSDLKGLKTEIYYGCNYENAGFTMGATDSLVGGNHNFSYYLLINGTKNGVHHLAKIKNDNENINLDYVLYYINKNTEYYGKSEISYCKWNKHAFVKRIQGKLRRKAIGVSYYLKNRDYNDSLITYYRIRTNGYYDYGNVRFIPGGYYIFRNDAYHSKNLYTNLISELQLPGVKIGILLNFLFRVRRFPNMGGKFFAERLEFQIFKRVTFSVSNSIFNIIDNYRLENIAEFYYGNGVFSGRGVLFKGKILYYRGNLKAAISFYSKKSSTSERKIRLDISYNF